MFYMISYTYIQPLLHAWHLAEHQVAELAAYQFLSDKTQQGVPMVVHFVQLKLPSKLAA